MVHTLGGQYGKSNKGALDFIKKFRKGTHIFRKKPH